MQSTTHPICCFNMAAPGSFMESRSRRTFETSCSVSADDRSRILPANETTTSRIVDFWCSRWLARRVDSPDVIAEVQRHSTVYPVAHGARVVSSGSSDESRVLFSDLQKAPLTRPALGAEAPIDVAPLRVESLPDDILNAATLAKAHSPARSFARARRVRRLSSRL